MRNIKRFRFTTLAMAVIMCFMLNACGTLPKTEEDAYMQVLTEHNALSRSFLAQYDLQAPETKAKWATQIAPIILKAGTAIGVWGKARGTGTEINKAALAQAAFEELKNLLLGVGIITIGGK